MSECDKAKIVGYVEQSPEQINGINTLKSIEISVVEILDKYLRDETAEKADKRWMSIAKTHIQQGFMAAVRAVARPNGD